MVIDYFSKWVEVAAYKKEVIDFIWQHIIYRFGIPKEITFDYGPQFIGSKVTKFLEDLHIKRITSSLYHPNGNGQVESTNKTVIQNLKKKLEDAKGAWSSKLPEVLWAYTITAKSSTGETPFSLVYGAEALIPVKFGTLSPRYNRAEEQPNTEATLVQLDFLEGHRDLAYVRMIAQN
ncbi:uncharacterized protein LOC132039466 [Lycium ferocissimum]|uniref:uncharacterized protein LOC132039466 n=1 Tax=Lycium ferocissimum TaxID=112874 RepID=UPI0028165B2A|nr:uncharacterized protein LOC132039466 [Lycium ferocissimum]